jgi:hypothetical protein
MTKTLFASTAALLLCACGARQPLEADDLSSVGGQPVSTGGVNPATGGVPASGGSGGSAGAVSTPDLVTLASGAITPFTLGIDATSVYWANYSYDGSYSGTVMKVAIAGGSSITLASGLMGANGIAVDASGVYFGGLTKSSAASSLFKVGLDGGAVKTLASGFMNDPFAIGPSGVYGTGSDGNGTTIVRVPLDGGATVPVVPSSSLVQTASSYGIAVDAANVYWTFFGSPTTVRKAPLGGGKPVTLATVDGPGSGIAVDASYVYFGTSSAVMKVPLNGGTPTTLASATGQGVAIDDDNVYFTDWSSTVKRVSKNGGAVVTLASGQLRPWPIAVDATSVYWGNCGADGQSNGSVMKLTPK